MEILICVIYVYMYQLKRNRKDHLAVAIAFYFNKHFYGIRTDPESKTFNLSHENCMKIVGFTISTYVFADCHLLGAC